MSISYNPMTMYGVHLQGAQQKELFDWLANNGYELTDDQLEQIDEDGIDQTGAIAGFTASVETENLWSGHGQAIGFHCGSSGATPEIIAQWSKEFPGVQGSFFSFVQVS